VGTRYKDPEYPVWVVCSESHYSVLFCPEGSRAVAPTEPVIRLHYYDGLANQQEDIILTVDRHPAKPPPEGPDDNALIPPLDLVIRTKWRGAAVSWNVEPIL
jgi:ubiquitin carboxyl-terminal hydrolase MINDY-3/4